MSKNKRELDRHPGTGGSIKSDAKRSGAGQHNWGNDQSAIDDAVVAHKEAEAVAAPTTANSTNPLQPPPPKDDLTSPESLGDLAGVEEQKPLDVSYEEFVKQQQRSGNKAYDARTVANSTFRADRYKGKNYFEKATDELLQGAQKEKKKERKPKNNKPLLNRNILFILPARE